jgi:predicted PurR-regulated permease PerM
MAETHVESENPPSGSTEKQATAQRAPKNHQPQQRLPRESTAGAGDAVSVEQAAWHDLRTWTVSNIIVATLLAVLIGFGFLLLYRFYMVVLIFFIGLSLSIAIKPATIYLQRFNIPPRISIILIYLLLALFTGLFLWIVIPLILTQVTEIIGNLPIYYNAVYTYLTTSPSDLVQSLGSLLPLHFTLLEREVLAQEGAPGSVWLVWEWLSSVANGTLILIVVLLLAYYWTLEDEQLLQRFLWRIPQERREEVRSFIEEVQKSIGGYVRGQTILCVIIGTASAAAFWLIGVPNALTLGLIMGILEAVPVIGPLLGAVPALLLTLSTAPEKTLWVIIALAGIQQLENSFLVPRVMDQSVGVNAIVSILAISAFGLLFGIVGAILAIPLAAILQILLNRLIFREPADLANEPARSVQQARDRYSVLRLEAQELAQDIRKQARSEENTEQTSRAEEEATDTIELLALELDKLLVGMERAA